MGIWLMSIILNLCNVQSCNFIPEVHLMFTRTGQKQANECTSASGIDFFLTWWGDGVNHRKPRNCALREVRGSVLGYWYIHTFRKGFFELKTQHCTWVGDKSLSKLPKYFSALFRILVYFPVLVKPTLIYYGKSQPYLLVTFTAGVNIFQTTIGAK